MEKPKLQAGDVFCVSTAGPLSYATRAVDRFWAKGDKAEFGHAGIVTGEDGSTFEALAKARQSRLDRYQGKHVLLARPLRTIDGGVILRAERVRAIHRLIQEHEGQWCPFWKLTFHIIPPLTKHISYVSRFLLCAEMTAKYEKIIGTRQGRFTGVNPDSLGVGWRCDKNYKIIHDDTWWWGSDTYGGDFLVSLQPNKVS